jgi:signal transduction protein with GAF and PtsI domain
MTDKAIIKELRKELAFLYTIAKSVHSLKIDELLNEIVEIASKITHADSCLIYILNRNKNELALRASKNPHPYSILSKITMKIGEGITGWVAKNNRPVIITNNAMKDPRFKLFKGLPEDKYEAFISFPIINKTGVMGVINIQHKNSHKFSDMEINLLTAIGKLVGGAVENALLIEETLVLKEALEIRKIIEKAKGILMKKKQINEDEAYKTLRNESMNCRKSLKEIAEAIITADNLKLD